MSSDLKRIAIISVHGCPLAPLGHKDTGGMNVYLRETSEALASADTSVDIFTRAHERGAPPIINLGPGVRIIHIAAGPLEEKKSGLFRHLTTFVNGVEAFRRNEGTGFDLVHSHYWLSGWAGDALASLWHIPHVVSFHTLGEIKRRARVGEREGELRIGTERAVMQTADRIVAFSQHEKEAMTQLYGAAPDKISIVPCGVNLARFRPLEQQASRTALGLREGEQLMLYVGRIEPLKGLDILLQAMALLEDREQLKLLIVGGDGSVEGEEGRIKALAQQLGLSEAVSFTGSLPQDLLPLYYSAADVVVMPSYYESFGLVALEALACSTPVVASRVGGLPTIVKDGENGFLVEPLCPDPFAERLGMVLANRMLRDSLSQAARPSVMGFSWQSAADQLLSVYASVTSAQWPGEPPE